MPNINELRAKELELVTQVESLERNIHGYKRKIGEYDSYLENLHVRDTSSLLPWLEEDNEERKELDQTDIIKVLTEEELKEIDEKDLEQKIGSLNEYMDEVKVDLDVLQEYARRFTEYSERKNDLNSSVERRDDMKQKCEELRKRRLDEFMTGFNMISSTLKEMYQMITMGGNAELELVDSLDPFSEGILFSVMPPKKSWKNISNLSGGEKTLSSLALKR
ncbi:unnamed protein product [[Candida] boidinii]|nr:unnamed protein product [[Candida] boidinii]